MMKWTSLFIISLPAILLPNYLMKISLTRFISIISNSMIAELIAIGIIVNAVIQTIIALNTYSGDSISKCYNWTAFVFQLIITSIGIIWYQLHLFHHIHSLSYQMVSFGYFAGVLTVLVLVQWIVSKVLKDSDLLSEITVLMLFIQFLIGLSIPLIGRGAPPMMGFKINLNQIGISLGLMIAFCGLGLIYQLIINKRKI